MEKPYSRLSNSEGNSQSVEKLLHYQSLPLTSEQSDDKDSDEFFGILRRRGIVIAGVVTTMMLAVGSLTLSQTPDYEGNFRLLVEPVTNDETVPDVASNNNPNNPKPTLDYETQIQVLKSPELLAEVAKELQASYSGITRDSLAKSLRITRVAETKVIDVRYQSNNPEKIKTILDKLANYYLKYSLEKQQTKLRQGKQFVDEQLPPLRKRVEGLQKELQDFRRAYQFSNPDAQREDIAIETRQLNEQRLKVDQQLSLVRSNFLNMQQRQVANAVLNESQMYQDIVRQVRQLDAQIAQELTRFQEGSPAVENLRERREKLLPLLQQEAQTTYNTKLTKAAAEVQNLEAQSRDLLQKQDKLVQKEKQLPLLARRYAEIQQELNIATDSLNRFLSTRETLQIKTAQSELPWQLIQAPELPKKPVSPNIERNLLFGLFGSLFLGISTALLIEKLDNTYHRVETLQEKLKLPLLGNIPFEKLLQKNQAPIFKTEQAVDSDFTEENLTHNENYNNKYPSEAFLEAFRVINTNLQLLSSDQPIRSIVVTSALPGDGKSTVAFHLARVAAAMGQKVLLVNADMRRPDKQSVVSLNNVWGLSSLISRSVKLEQVIQQVPGINDFSMIAAGPVPPDATKLLSSEKMRLLMADLRKQFDLVIYDTPPLIGLADTNLIAPHTDGILLVAKIDQTDRSALKQAMESLKVSRINVLGFAANGTKGKMPVHESYRQTAVAVS